jgi:GrpB-like predicted nucleotidyltransferase (UPF0157 family)
MKKRTETLEEKVARVVHEDVTVVPYDSRWPEIFEHERLHLLSCLPADLIRSGFISPSDTRGLRCRPLEMLTYWRVCCAFESACALPAGVIRGYETTSRRIEHFGSTAVPGLPAKPIVDILVEVASLDETKQRIVPILEAQGYEYFWRPSWGDDTPPFYAWFIKRDKSGNRTHHIHMVESHFEHWDRLLFRDYLIEHPDIAREYGNLKMRLSGTHQNDRVAYTQAKSDFIRRVTASAKQHYGKAACASSTTKRRLMLDDRRFKNHAR